MLRYSANLAQLSTCYREFPFALDEALDDGGRQADVRLAELGDRNIRSLANGQYFPAQIWAAFEDVNDT
jgi:hypothetical protein